MWIPAGCGLGWRDGWDRYRQCQHRAGLTAGLPRPTAAPQHSATFQRILLTHQYQHGPDQRHQPPDPAALQTSSDPVRQTTPPSTKGSEGRGAAMLNRYGWDALHELLTVWGQENDGAFNDFGRRVGVPTFSVTATPAVEATASDQVVDGGSVWDARNTARTHKEPAIPKLNGTQAASTIKRNHIELAQGKLLTSPGTGNHHHHPDYPLHLVSSPPDQIIWS